MARDLPIGNGDDVVVVGGGGGGGGGDGRERVGRSPAREKLIT